MKIDAHVRDLAADVAYQSHLLEGVSRTFAITIPQLPPGLFEAVANAYLLCRIADTIEDDAGLDAAAKRVFVEQFIRVLEGAEAPMRLSDELFPVLAESTPHAERELILNVPRVVRVTRSLDEKQQAPMRRCVRIMSRGMADFQASACSRGLADLQRLDRYCYYVAGVVGEMLTELFCYHSAEMDRHRDELLPLAVNFGQGLQMTNILKDVWEDHTRGACWLPRDVFARHHFDLDELSPGCRDAGFLRGYAELVAVARDHLAQALEFTLSVPPSEVGIRRFCLWALGMAVLTLRRVHAHPGFRSANDVKISRRQVSAVITTSNLAVGSDWLLRALFTLGTQALPSAGGLRQVMST